VESVLLDTIDENVDAVPSGAVEDVHLRRDVTNCWR
jgi:hypothetical protein